MSLFQKPKTFYERLIIWSSSLQSLLLLATRLLWGALFAQAGWGKLMNVQESASSFREIGIPFPELSVYLAGGAEFFCGLLLVVGLASRLAALPLIIVMIVAYMTADREVVANIFSEPLKFIHASPFTFLFSSLIILIFGPGKFSIDYLLERIFFKTKKIEPKEDVKV